jgi:hypothetical protein
VYGAEIARGLDILRLTPSEHLSQNEIAAASQVRVGTFNAQEQPRLSWPATSHVAHAYVDQLLRRRTMSQESAAAIGPRWLALISFRRGGKLGPPQHSKRWTTWSLN